MAGTEEQSLLLQLCQDLVTCINKIMDPIVPQSERAECSEKIEHFKDESPYCLRCGFVLAEEQIPQIKHFGLQLLEHFVKYRWDALSIEDGKQFRINLLQYATSKLLPHEQELPYVKEALARVTVETAKKMWPQRWDSFFADMDTLSKCGSTQVELVLLIFRRLSEDIHVYQSGVPSLRRREMAAALNEQSKSVFAYLINNLEAPLSDHMLLVSLSTIVSFVEWVDFGTVLIDDAKVIRLLYAFIGVEELKTVACECLLVILARKGDIRKTETDRTRILSLLLSREALSGIMEASVLANSQGVVEEQYVFLKRVCQLLVHLGSSQLALLWTYSSAFKPPDTLELYMQLVGEFTKHDSQLLSLVSADVWICFLSHNHLKDHPVFKSFLPQLLTIARQKLLKVGDPSVSDHISSDYSRLDFDGIDEFMHFFATFRGKMTKIVSHVVLLMPRTAAKEALFATEQIVQKKLEVECTRSTMLYIEWDGLVAFLDCWTGTLKGNAEFLAIQEVIDVSLKVLHLLLSYETADPLLLQLLFRSLQTGLLFIDKDQSVFQAFVQKIFSCVGFLGNKGDKYHLPKDTVNTRNAVTTCFVRLCEAQPSLMAPHVEQLFSEHYQALLKNDVLVYAEKCNFIESFYILSQKKHSLEEQSVFIEKLLEEPKYLLQEMECAVSSPQSLVSYLCLDRSPSDPTYECLHRYRLCFVVHIVALVLKRSTPAEDQSHPTYSQVLPFVYKFILPLLSSVYQLWSEDLKKSFSEYFQSVAGLHQFEKDTILGRTMLRRSETEDFGELGHMQMNLASAHEGCVSSISRCFVVFGCKHMTDIGFVNITLQTVMEGIVHLNLLRLRVLILSFCYKSEESLKVILPLLSYIGSYIFSKLRNAWDTITQKRGIESANEANRDSTVETAEILDEQVTILLSREYIHLLDLVCVKRNFTPNKSKGKQTDSGEVAMSEEMTDVVPTQDEENSSLWSSIESLAPLGEQLIQTPEMCELLFISSFCGLTWCDSQTANKCVTIAGVLFSKVPATCFPNHVYEKFFSQVLLLSSRYVSWINYKQLPASILNLRTFMWEQWQIQALHIHGIQDHNRVQLSLLAMLIYESTVQYCPKLQDIVSQVANVQKEKLQSFNAMLSKEPPVPFKVRKEAFRELLSGAVGKPIGEIFKRPITFDLPEMQFKHQSKSTRSEIDISDLATLFGKDY